MLYMLLSTFPYLQVTKRDRALVGKPDPGTRMFRMSGPEEDFCEWFDKLSARFPGELFFSPGGTAGYVRVSRAAVYLRMNSGKLTVFSYHPSKVTKTRFGGVRKTRETPYVFIPISECKGWAAELKERIDPPDDPGWLPDREYNKLADKIEQFPKHTGKTSLPKWKQKKLAAWKESIGKLLSLVIL